MRRVKREPGSNSARDSNTGVRELRSRRIAVDSSLPCSASNHDEQQEAGQEVDDEENEVAVRRSIRSRYLAVKNLLSGIFYSDRSQCSCVLLNLRMNWP